MAGRNVRGKSASGVKSYGAGIGNAASYLVAGTPYIQYGDISASAETTIAFPNVAMRLTVENNDVSGSADSLRVHFGPTASAGGQLIVDNNRFIELFPGGTWTADIKCSNVYLSTPATNVLVIPYGVIAELTGIEAGYQPTGSGVTI